VASPSAAVRDVKFDGRRRHRLRFVQHLGRQKRIVGRADAKRRRCDRAEEVDGAGAGIVIVGVAKAVNRRRGRIVDVAKGLRTHHRLQIDAFAHLRKMRHQPLGLLLQRRQKTIDVEAAKESVLEMF